MPFILAANRSKDVLKRIEDYLSGIVDVKDLMMDVRKAGGIEAAKKLKERYIEKCRKLLSHCVLEGNSTLAADGIYAMEEILSWL